MNPNGQTLSAVESARCELGLACLTSGLNQLRLVRSVVKLLGSRMSGMLGFVHVMSVFLRCRSAVVSKGMVSLILVCVRFAYKVSAGDYPFYRHIPTMNIWRGNGTVSVLRSIPNILHQGNSSRVGYHVETANQLYDECVQFKEKKQRDAWAKEKEKELKALVPSRQKVSPRRLLACRS